MDETVRKISADDINPRFNWGRALPALGTMGVDFEERVDYRRLHRYRLSRVRQALEKSELGALLVFDVNNIRYITSTKIGEWERDKLCRWALLARDRDPILWDFGSAAVHHKLYTPWLKPEDCKAGLIGLRGTVNPAFGLMERHAKEIASLLKEAGVHKMPVGVDIIEPPMMFELEKAGLKIKDGQQVMLEARELKNIDEIALLNRAAAMVDGAYHLINEELKPGVRENDIVAKVNEFLPPRLRRRGSDQCDLGRALQSAPAQFHRPHAAPGRPGVLRHPAIVHGLPHLLLPHLQCRASDAGAARRLQEGARLARQGHRPDQAWRHHRSDLQGVAQGAGIRLSRRDVGLRPAIRTRARPCAARAADHFTRGLARPSDRNQGGHGIRARDLLPGGRRVLRRPHRGGGRGDRQGLPRDHAVPGRRATHQPPV